MNANSNTIDMFGCKYREGSFTGTFGKCKVPLSVYDILSLGLLTKLTVPDKSCRMDLKHNQKIPKS